jgi:tetratricopeptide (TPR) repeat protein
MANKGFGSAKSESSQSAKQFMLAFKKYWQANPDLKNAHQFFSSHLLELNESLLKSLPSIFRDLTKNKTSQEQYLIAALFANFGTVIQDFPLGDRALNLELSLTASQLGLKVFTRNAFPENWAATQNNLGEAYRNRIRGERADNIEQAIASYELALLVRARDAFPEDWAGTQNNLGAAYRDRIRGERADNIELAIASYELALQITTHDAFPEEWAITQNNLGLAYWTRIRGERADNIELAIASYELALLVRTRDAFPEYWADTQNNLGLAYWTRIRGERADNIELAITSYKLALLVRTRDAFPEYWAVIQNNLGLACYDRIKGERADNIELAIASFEIALQVYTRDSFPEYWAKTQHNLARPYRDRISGDRAENLEQAINLFNQAEQVLTRESFPENWSINQAHLAEALIKRSALTDNCTDLDTAIELLQSSLELSVVGSPDYIDTNYRLGNALSRRYEHTKNAAELERAMQAYKIALDAISPEHYDRQKIWQSLPSTQAILGSRLVRDGQWQEGLQLLLNSLNQLGTYGDPLAHANALYQTGRAYEVMADLEKARTYYRDALRLYEHLKDQLGTTQSHAGLGSVLVSQGYLEKGLNELEKVHDGYLLLPKDTQTEFDNIYQAAKRALERSNNEVYV